MTPRQRRERTEATERTPRLMGQAQAAVAELRRSTAELHGILEEVRREVRQVAAEDQQ